jgi:hypothetical protein
MPVRPATVLGLCGALAGCGGDDTVAPPPRSAPVTSHHAHGVRYSAPAGWHAAARPQTNLANPAEVLTVATGRLPGRGGRCGHMPSRALEAMGPGDVLVSLQERTGSPTGFPPRPARFTLPAPIHTDADECAGPHPAFTSRWLEFADGGRAFHVLVAVGRSASSERVHEAEAILDSLRVSPRS